MTEVPSIALRNRWLEQLLIHVPDKGWTEAALKLAAREASLSSDEQALAAPRGLRDLIDQFFANAEEAVRDGFARDDTADLRVHEKVAKGVKLWLGALEPNREAVRRAVARGLLPWETGGAANRLWSISDTIWDAAGDTAQDYNRQTKRALLYAVLPPITFYWLYEPSEEDLDAFIMRQLKGAMRLGQAGGRVLGPVMDLAERLRPGGKPGES